MTNSTSVTAVTTAILNDIADGGHVIRQLWRKLQATFGYRQTTLCETGIPLLYRELYQLTYHQRIFKAWKETSWRMLWFQYYKMMLNCYMK